MDGGPGELRDAVTLRETVPRAEQAPLLRLEPHASPRDEHCRDNDILVGSDGPNLRQLDPPPARRYQRVGWREEGAAAAPAAAPAAGLNVVVRLPMLAKTSASGSGHVGRGGR